MGCMKVNKLAFGSITIDGESWEDDIVIANGHIKKRKKDESKKYRGQFGHTPLSVEENIPWECKRLIIGTGHSASLPVMDEVYRKAEKQGVKIITMPTGEAIRHVDDPDTNLVLHLTC
jgi:hypothetical protein